MKNCTKMLIHGSEPAGVSNPIKEVATTVYNTNFEDCTKIAIRGSNQPFFT